MSQDNVQSKINSLLTEYSALDRDIRALSWLLEGLIFISGLLMAWAIWKSESDDIWRLARIIGVLISALIISKAASRLICHTELVRQNDRARSVARLTHHAMAVLSDLKQRVAYAKELLQNGGRPLVALSRNAKSIEEHYHTFYQRELYELLSPRAIEIIVGMSGAVFGLCAFAEALEHDHSMITIFPHGQSIPNTEGMIESLDGFIDEASRLDDEFREIRRSALE